MLTHLLSALWRLFPLLALLLLAACSKPGSEAVSEEEAPLVLAPTDVARVETGTLTTGVALTGTLDPWQTVEVKAQVAGTIGALRVQEGDRVAAGTVLATITAQGVQSQASSSRAAVAAAEAQLALAREQAESAELLFNEGALSRLDYQAAQAGVEAALAQVAAARSQASGAQEQAGRTTLRSPIGGAVSSRQVEMGEAVNPGQTLFTIVNTQSLELNAQVGVAEAARIKTGDAVEFRIDAYPDQPFRGTVSRIEPTADPATRQVGVYLRLPNPGGLVGGLFATGTVVSETQQAALLVPTAALREEGDAAYVLVVADSTIQRRDVTVTGRDAQRGVVAIRGEVAARDVVVVAPTANAVAGSRVRIAGAASRPDTSAAPLAE